MIEHVEAFRQAIERHGLQPGDIEPGRLHRFPGADKGSDNRAGWARLFEDGQGGAFGDWSSPVSGTWQAERAKPMTPEEQAAFRRKVAEAKQKAEQTRKAEQAAAAKRAEGIWKAAPPAPADHPYLKTKNVQAHGLRLYDDALVIPLRDESGALCSLQFIGPDCKKRFLKDGKKQGCYFAIGGKPEKVLCVAEGYATAATIHEATGLPVAVAFDAGNLKPVSLAIRAKLPDTRLIICADDDADKKKNTGLIDATEAALAVGGLVAVPDFGPDRQEGLTDFNDLARVRGPEAVRVIIEAAQSVDQAEPVQKVEPGDDEATIQRLVALSPFQYDRERKKVAASLRVRPATLDNKVKAARKEEETDTGLVFDDLEPWPDPVNGAALLAEVAATVQRFIVCQPETARAVALWASMTWFMDVVQVAPLAVITAPEKRCGKSQLLFLLGRLVYRPLTASNISTAALFRTIDAWRPTMLVDEADSFMKENEDMRGLLNSGHTRDGAYIIRVVGDNHEPTRFNTWGAKALAGIGRIADTLMDRAVVLELRRKLPNEKVERLRYAEQDLFETLAEKLCRFAEDHREAVRKARPDLPAKLNDRAQDNWEPLLAIADVAGGLWPSLARAAALKLSGASESSLTIGVELLSDIQEVWEAKRVDRISTADLIAALCEDEEKPWATYNKGFQIKPRQVARKLSEYGISSNTIRIGPATPKGFMREQFTEAFSRYLASPPSPSATPPQPIQDGVLAVAGRNSVAVTDYQKVTRKPAWGKACGGVADKTGGMGEKEIITVAV